MSYEIRPMSLAELLDTSFQLLRDRFLLLVGLAALVQVPLSVLFGPVLRDPAAFESLGDDALVAMGALFVLYGFVAAIGFTWIAAAITRALGDVFLGRPARLGSSLVAGLRRLVPLLATFVIYGVIATVAGVALVMMAMAMVMVPLGAIGGDDASGAAAVAGVAAMLGSGVLVYVLIGTPALILTQLVVLEGTGYFHAIGRAFELVSGQRLRVVGITLVAGLLAAIPVGGLAWVSAFWPWIGAVVSGLGGALANAFTSAATVLLYFDLRCRKEAFDLEHLARLVEARTPRPHAPAPGSPP